MERSRFLSEHNNLPILCETKLWGDEQFYMRCLPLFLWSKVSSEVFSCKWTLTQDTHQLYIIWCLYGSSQ